MRTKTSCALRLRIATGGFLLLCLTGCQQKEPGHSALVMQPQQNRKKYAVSMDEPRGWSTYPVIVLVAAKHHIGVDTVTQMAQQFDKLFDGEGIEVEAKLPEPLVDTQEELLAPNAIPNYFKTQEQAFGLSKVQVAVILNDFYLLGGSNRNFPDPVPAQ